MARRLHARLLDSKVGLDNFTAAGLVGVYTKCGHLDDAVAVYDGLMAAEGRPDTTVISALANAFRKHGQPARALSLLDHIERFHIVPDKMCLHQLAAACGETGDVAAAKRVLAWLQDATPRLQGHRGGLRAAGQGLRS